MKQQKQKNLDKQNLKEKKCRNKKKREHFSSLYYISISKGGTIIIYDESPKTIGFEDIKVLKNDEYKKKLGNEARKSMEFNL